MIELRLGDPRYPTKLAESGRPPDRLWVLGHLPRPGSKCVAIVGTRRMTDYGHRIAREVATNLARAGAVIVSGLAQGIDSTAHSAAIAVDGTTVAVLGEGLLAFESSGPWTRRRIAAAILERGAVMSQYPVDTHGDGWTFPERNATIAGLADVTVVVEAPVGSGALITARFAEAMERPIYAPAGPLGAPTWRGSDEWIATGRARLLTSVAQIADELQLKLPTPRAPQPDARSDRVLELLRFGPADADAIAQGMALASADAAMVIAELLIGGSIVATGDGRFARR